MSRIGFLICALLTLLPSTVSADRPFRDCARCPEMVPLSPGSFVVGHEGGKVAEAPLRPARIDRAFAIARTETTFDQFALCVEEGGCEKMPFDRNWGRGNRPAIYVTWNMAAAYARWLSRKTGRTYRLPREVEWEYAAQGGTGRRAQARMGYANCHGCIDNWNHQTWPVAGFPPNGYGLFDMLGNVMEWTADCWRPTNASEAPKDCDKRTRKGGSWYFDGTVSTSSYRYGGRLSHTGYDIGFRVVADLP